MICEKYGLDTTGLSFLGSPNDAQRERLNALLNPLRGISPKILATKSVLSSRRDPSTPHEDRPLRDYKQEPEPITALRNRARLLHKTESASHAEMRLTDDRKRRYALAFEIMVTIRPALDAIYDQIREWEKTGLLPTNPNTEGDRSGEATLRRLLNLRSHVCKLRKELEKGGWKDTIERRKRLLLDMKLAEIAEIEKQIGNG